LIKKLFRKYSELTFWIAALIALGFSNPAGASHYVLCPFRLMGFKWCPGCGIGHSIAWLLHGNIRNSLHAHWLGIPALIMIIYRIIILFKNNVLGWSKATQGIFETTKG
jgi:hypothetical protein